MKLTKRDLIQLENKKGRLLTITSPYFKSLPLVQEEEIATREKQQEIRKKERIKLYANVSKETRGRYNRWIKQV